MSTTSAKVAKNVAPLSVPSLPADLDAGLRRLKLAAIRRTAPEVLITAKTQRWTPEEVLRTLVETELAARDASNVVNRLKAAGFPVTKTLVSFDVASSSIQPKVFDYLSSLEWIRTQQNLAIIGPGVIDGSGAEWQRLSCSGRCCDRCNVRRRLDAAAGQFAS
jgi:hypothetical protein